MLWKPAISWCIDRIHVLREIKFTSFRRNEVNGKAAVPKTAIFRNGGPAPIYFADEDRTQRNTVALSEVDYVVEAHFTTTDKAGAGDNVNKFVEMFNRRVEKGQHFHQPYFGCREFVAHVVAADGAPTPIQDSRDLGWMLWDIRFSKSGNEPVFFPARLTDGVLQVPVSPGTTVSSTPAGIGGEA